MKTQSNSEQILASRLQKLVDDNGFKNLKELLDSLEIGETRLVKCDLYQVFITDAACKWLNDNGIHSFVRSANYYALDDLEAFQQFKKDYPYIPSLLMVNITKI